MRTACRVSDWRGLRKALGFSQRDFAVLLFCSEDTLCRLEKGGHRPHPRIEDFLRYLLRSEPELQRRLHAKNIAYPWPEDLAS